MENSNKSGAMTPETEKPELLKVEFQLYLWGKDKTPPPLGIIQFPVLELADMFLLQLTNGSFQAGSEAILNEVWLRDGQPVKELVRRQLFLATDETEHKLIECEELVYDNSHPDPGFHLVSEKPKEGVTIRIPMNRKGPFRKIN